MGRNRVYTSIMPRKRASDPAASQDRWEEKIKAKNPEFLAHINQFLKPYRLPDGQLQHDDQMLLDLQRKIREWKKQSRLPPDERPSGR